MEGIFSLLLFAGVFYLMMRFGCGAHMVHDGKEYRFCSRNCLEKFDAEPARYLVQKGELR
jgi:hypothetical protein